MTEDGKMSPALFRYSLTAPPVAGSYMEASKAAYYRNAGAGEYTAPDGSVVHYSGGTIKKWYCEYGKKGLNALMPVTRNDCGRSRKLPDAVIGKIREYRTVMPYITVKKIYDRLIEEGYLNKAEISIDTLYRHMRREGNAPDIPREECPAFEFEHAGDCRRRIPPTVPPLRRTEKE